MQAEPTQTQQQISTQIANLKKMFNLLETSKLEGSAITIVIPPKKAIHTMTSHLNEEQGKASNIKDRVNRNSVVDAIKAAKDRLKLYKQTPENGLILFSGKLMPEGTNSYDRMVIDFEPYKPIHSATYSCAQQFYLEELKQELLFTDKMFGFIIADGSGALFAGVQGRQKNIIKKFTTELPNRHKKGGQSQQRYDRLRVQAKNALVRKICELASTCYLSNARCNVSGLILAGPADLKKDILQSKDLDARLRTKVLSTLTISCTSLEGLEQAVKLSQAVLTDLELLKQKEILEQLFTQISIEEDLVVNGVEATLRMLEMGAIKHLICCNNVSHLRVTVQQLETQSTLLVPSQNLKQTEEDLQTQNRTIVSVEPVTEWLENNCQSFGCRYSKVSPRTAEAVQFMKGYGGIGGILRYKTEMNYLFSQETMQDESYFM